MDVLERDGSAPARRRRARSCATGLLRAADRHAVVGDVRGRGLHAGPRARARPRRPRRARPSSARAVTARCLELGLHMNIVQLREMGGTFRIAPPLTTTAEELELGCEILDQAIGECARGYDC